MKRFLFLFLATLMAIGLFLAWQKPATIKIPSPDAAAPSPPALATAVADGPSVSNIHPAASPAPAAPRENTLSAESRKAVQECLGQEAATWDELDKILIAKATSAPHLQWKLASVLENGQELRLRLAPVPQDSGESPLRVQLFSVDKEGLPDLLSPRPGQNEEPANWMETFMRGKEILRRASREIYPLPGNGSYERETENGQVTEARAQLGANELDCGRRSESEGCLCRESDGLQSAD